jgi:hypothetical protein
VLCNGVELQGTYWLVRLTTTPKLFFFSLFKNNATFAQTHKLQTMNIPLSQFENHIDETILKRGLSYFKKGLVLELSNISTNEYEAIVRGTEDYTVRLTIKNDVITKSVCSCPYDMGPVCKHTVAVIFEMQKDILGLKTKPPKTTDAHIKKSKTTVDKIAELLENISHDELKNFVYEQSVQDKKFRNMLLVSFVLPSEKEASIFYAKQVKSILRSNTNRDGFIEWSEGRQVRIAIDKLLQTAQKLVDGSSFATAVHLCSAIMEQTCEALQYADDSNGEVGHCVNAAYEMLQQIANMDIDEPARILLFEYCLSAFEKNVFSGWGWHTDILEIASLLLKTGEEKLRLLKCIEQAEHTEFDRGNAQNIKYSIILKTEGGQAAERFMEQNLSNSDFRQRAIQNAFDNRNFERAISLAKDGINFDKEERPGLVKEWVDWLLKIAQTQQDTDRIIEYARRRYLDNSRSEQDYYQILKQAVKPEEWNAFVEKMLTDIAVARNHFDYSMDMAAQIYIREQWWERLMKLLENTLSREYPFWGSQKLDIIAKYEKYLAADYSDKITDWYVAEIKQYMESSTSRVHYQNACRYLRRIIKLDAGKKAAETIQFLRSAYPRRKALMEELDKV